MIHAVGTLKWARKTGGRLGFFDRVQLGHQAIKLRALRRQQAMLTYPVQPLLDGDLDVPDSAIAKQAVSIAQDLSDPQLLNHCFRTFFWGKTLAKSEAIRFDPELFFVSCLLHDLGLAKAHAQGKCGEHCFAVSSARRAGEAMKLANWGARQTEALEEAITLHLNILVPLKQGAEAHLLHAGAALDVVGARYAEVRGPVADAVLQRHPRLSFKRDFPEALRHQCAVRPSARLAFFVERGFYRLIEKAPFET